MQSFVFKRLLVYPLVFIILTNVLYFNYPAARSEIDNYKNSLPFEDSTMFSLILFGYLLGYVYGTLSLIIEVRSFRSILLLIIMFVLKLFFSMILAVSFGIFVLPFELVIILLFGFKKSKKIIRPRKRKEKYIQTKEKDELIKEMENLIQQYKSQAK
ncbi:hypothetical protein KM915_20795 [Cytobacillus oceanisediminis]|uniref:hypothetical protein n=1 Tax=Cytobacillus oceanisediminis TaxID=665099 RepID=UPI001C2216FC|nr:hypothetical protein [Cytobacillus oceanisediminis]MBU8732489.1 hypothetical protein [Cytobacillus oceanisediminis]